MHDLKDAFAAPDGSYGEYVLNRFLEIGNLITGSLRREVFYHIKAPINVISGMKISSLKLRMKNFEMK